jgi:molecular chaperone IbpA
MRTDLLANFHDDFYRSLNRFSVGLEPTFRRLLDFDRDAAYTNSYPPYNIRQLDETNFQIDIALAGFKPEEISVQLQNQELTVQGIIDSEQSDESRNYLYKSIAGRSFIRRFKLGDFVEVKNAKLENSLLTVDLQRYIPEAAKPKEIKVEVVNTVLNTKYSKQIDAKSSVAAA